MGDRVSQDDKHPPLDGEARIACLENEVQRILGTLGQTAASAPISGPHKTGLVESGDAPQNARADRARHVRQVIRQRRQREQYLPADIFADPAWDMILDLYAAHLEGNLVSVSSLCIAAAVPQTTALRWIKLLTEKGLFRRTEDPADGRRINVDLSEEARSQLDAYFGSIES